MGSANTRAEAKKRKWVRKITIAEFKEKHRIIITDLSGAQFNPRVVLTDEQKRRVYRHRDQADQITELVHIIKEETDIDAALGTDDFRNIMKAGSGGTGMTDDQKALLPKLKARGMAVLESCGEYDMLGTSSYRFFPEEDVIAHSADGTDQLGGGAACCEEINLVDGTVTIMCIDTAVADVAVNSLGRLDAVKDRERVTQLISCAHAASLHDYNKAARLPGFTFQLALEKMITFNAMRGNDKLHPFVLLVMGMKEYFNDNVHSLVRRGYTEENFAQAVQCIFCSHLLFFYPAHLYDLSLAEQPCKCPKEDVEKLMKDPFLAPYLERLLEHDLVWLILDPSYTPEERIAAAQFLPFPLYNDTWVENNRDGIMYTEIVIEQVEAIYADKPEETSLPSHNDPEYGYLVCNMKQRFMKMLGEGFGTPVSYTCVPFNFEEGRRLIQLKPVAAWLEQRILLGPCKALLDGEPITPEMRQTVETSYIDMLFKANYATVQEANANNQPLDEKSASWISSTRTGLAALLRNETTGEKLKHVNTRDRANLVLELPQIQEWIKQSELEDAVEVWKAGKPVPQDLVDKVNTKMKDNQGANGFKLNDKAWSVNFTIFKTLTSIPAAADEDGPWWHQQTNAMRDLLLNRKTVTEVMTPNRMRQLAALPMVEEYMKKVQLCIIWEKIKADPSYKASKAEVDAADAAARANKGNRNDEEWRKSLVKAIATPLDSEEYKKGTPLCRFAEKERHYFKQLMEGKIKNTKMRIERADEALEKWPAFLEWATETTLLDLYNKVKAGVKISDDEMQAMERRFKAYNNKKAAITRKKKAEAETEAKRTATAAGMKSLKDLFSSMAGGAGGASGSGRNKRAK